MQITVKIITSSPLEDCWNAYTLPEHITRWNFADPSWHCPSAQNDLRVGGTYLARMEAKDGSFGFDFEAVYTNVQPMKSFTYTLGGRNATVVFSNIPEGTEIVVSFDPESENPIELQQNGWQAILRQFKFFVENQYKS